MTGNLSNTDLLVMGILCDKPVYGYELKQIADKWHIDLWSGITLSSIYHSLKKLEKLQYVNKECRKKGHMEQRIYQLTDQGTGIFLELVFDKVASFETLGPQFGIPAMFVKHLPQDRLLEALEKRRAEIQHRLSSYTQCMGGQEHVDNTIRNNGYANAGSYLLWLYDHELQWLDTYIQTVHANHPK